MTLTEKTYRGLMDKETEVYYNHYFDLFNNDGWKQLIGELTQNAVVINSVENLKDEQDMYVKKGQLNVLASILNFETTIRNAYEEATKVDEDV